MERGNPNSMNYTINKIDMYILSFISIIWGGAILFSTILDSQDFILSLSIVVSIFIFLSGAYFKKESIFRLKYIYVFGFSLFICGRFFAYLIDPSINIFLFDFGLFYEYDSSSYLEKIRLYNFIFLAFLFYVAGLSVEKKCKPVLVKNNNKGVHKKRFLLFFMVAILLFIFLLKNNFESVLKSISDGYLSLYESQGRNTYETPINLIINAMVVSLMAIFYIIRTKNNKFKLLFLCFITIQLMTIFTGARGGFVSSFFMILWFFFKDRPVTFRMIFLLVIFILSLIFLVNFLLYFTSRSAEEGNIIEIVASNLSNQGVSLMVFDLSTKIDSYPMLGLIKTFIPGSHLLFNFFVSDLAIHEVSFPHYITFISAPTLYYQGYGYGWSLLSDFYVFSFSMLPIFLLFNFIWGRVISTLDNNVSNSYLEGMTLIFITHIFMISRSSISTLIAGVLIYSLIYLFTFKIKVFK